MKKFCLFCLCLLSFISFSFADTTYIVEKGDTLYSISRKNQITVAELRAANNLSESDVLKAGQKLIIPEADIGTAVALSASKEKSAPSENKNVKTSVYTVAKGDTLYGIARKNGMTVAELLSINNLDSNVVIKVGQKLKITKDEIVTVAKTNTETKTNNSTKTTVKINDKAPDTRTYGSTVSSDANTKWPVKNPKITSVRGKVSGVQLSAKEKSIAILVRENWQADMIRTDCAKLGISVHTNTGGDLYMSQPALDMLTLVNALVHFDEADYLYNLVTSNFFNLDIPKSNLYEIRMKIRTEKWRAKTDEKEQVNYLINFMNLMLANTVDKNNKWEYIVASLRTQPILQAIRKVYSTLEPWKHFSSDPWKQHYYQLNVDLLFEQIINACNVDRLTINTLQDHLHNSIVSQVSVDSRTPAGDKDEVAIQCITVHKSKGLEYGHVIMPFCSASINFIKKTQLHISTSKHQDRYRIGYCMSIGDSGETIQNDFYDEIMEKSEKAREEARVLYVAMTRSIRSFSWVEIQGKQNLSWQNLIETEE